MIPIDINEADCERTELYGKSALYTELRIDKNTLPDGVYAYDIRHGDDGNPASLENHVTVNHLATVITKEPIEIGKDGYKPLNEDDINFLGERMSLNEYIESEECFDNEI